MELDFIDNSDNVGVSSVREVEVLLHQGIVAVTSDRVQVEPRRCSFLAHFAARDSSTNHKQGPAFPPMLSMPMLFPGSPAAKAPMQSTVVPLQSAAMPPMAGRCAIAQSEDALP